MRVKKKAHDRKVSLKQMESRIQNLEYQLSLANKELPALPEKMSKFKAKK